MRWWIRNMLYLPPEASTASWSIDNLHFAVIATTMFGATVVFVVALYFNHRYRQRNPGELTPRFHVPKSVEIALITGTLGLFLLFWAIGVRQYNELESSPPHAIDIYVMAKQWMWKFAYSDGRESVGELVVPVGRPVRLVMTSRDVIHSFFVPAFRIKQDVVPGRYVTTWFEATEPGTYDVFCTEYCGTSHSRMRAAVTVLDAVEYAQWLGHQPRGGVDSSLSPTPHGEFVAQGQDVAARRGCFHCHTIDGQRFIGPTWRALFNATIHLSDGRTIVADEAYLTRSMMDPTVDVVAGFSSVMPTYRGFSSLRRSPRCSSSSSPSSLRAHRRRSCCRQSSTAA